MTYRFVNRIVLGIGLLIGVVILVWHIWLTGQCASIVLWNRPCALCGCTRDFISLASGNLSCRNVISLPLFVIGVCELFWRVIASIMDFRKVTIFIDMALHIVLLLVFVGYNFAFYFCGSSPDKGLLF